MPHETQRDEGPTQGTHTGDPHRGPTQRGGPHRGSTTGGEGHTGDPHRTHTDKKNLSIPAAADSSQSMPLLVFWPRAGAFGAGAILLLCAQLLWCELYDMEDIDTHIKTPFRRPLWLSGSAGEKGKRVKGALQLLINRYG